MLAGPKESSYYRTAERCAKIIARSGVTLQVIETEGAQDNLRRLADRKVYADVGFVVGGVTEGIDTAGLISLGSVFVQPVLVFYRGKESVDRLSQLEGKRLAIGPEGSGTHAIAMKFLVANGMDKGSTRLLELDGDDAVEALKQGKIDAAFLMGELVRGQVLRDLLKVPGIKLMNFAQADGYMRRLTFLSRLTLPKGAFDLGQDLPRNPVELVGPTLELVARENLHPAACVRGPALRTARTYQRGAESPGRGALTGIAWRRAPLAPSQHAAPSTQHSPFLALYFTPRRNLNPL